MKRKKNILDMTRDERRFKYLIKKKHVRKTPPDSDLSRPPVPIGRPMSIER